MDDDHRLFWQRKLQAPLSACTFPSDRPRPPMQALARDVVKLSLPPAVARELRRLGDERADAALCAALHTLVCRYTDTTDSVIGFMGDARSPAVARLAAYPLVPLRIAVDREATASDLIGSVRGAIDEASKWSAGLDGIADLLGGDADPSRAPVLQIAIDARRSVAARSVLPGSEAAHWVRTDLALIVSVAGDRFEVECEYDEALFERVSIERLLRSWCCVLGDLLCFPDRAAGQLRVLSDEDWAHVLATSLGPSVACRDSTLCHLVAEQCERTPDSVALVCAGRSVTYQELWIRVADIAAVLSESGISRGAVVGIFLERGADLLPTLLAVMATGAAYVPLDPDYPVQRLRHMVDDAGVCAIVTSTALTGRAPGAERPCICVDSIPEPRGRVHSASLQIASAPDDIAYVIYTSGSTGRPKGVCVTHRSITNFVLSMVERPGVTRNDRLAAVTTLSFDIAVLELYVPLIVGACVLLVDADVSKSGVRLRELLDSQGATIMQATPTTWLLLCTAGWRASTPFKALCGGETMPPALASELLERAASVWNLYGPTETTVWSTRFEVKAVDALIAVGRAIANTAALVLDPELQPVPLGAIGELYIGGHGVASYHRREDLTRERFLAHGIPDLPCAILYRTGDRARYRHDGNLELLGRTDQQIKLRGFRIELGEVESVLSAHPEVQRAVVVVRERQPGDQRLVAYVVPRAGGRLAPAELRRHALDRLPAYMVPSAFVVMDALPLTLNGKVDKAQLPSPERVEGSEGNGADETAPQRSLTEIIAEIWTQVLGVERVGIRENFFELGGHSLLLAKVQIRLEAILGRELSSVEFFRYPTIELLARRLSEVDVDVQGTAAAGNAPQPAEHMAVVGIACRFPGAGEPEQFWANLRDGVESITRFSDLELLSAGVSAAALADPNYVRAAPVLRDVECFDADFFGIGQREAELLDPQHRLFLECAWEALEAAGYAAESERRIGVFASADHSTYLVNNLRGCADVGSPAAQYAVRIGNDKDFLATRTSYKLDLNGPSVSVQTACSSSLVAVHLGMQSLAQGECDLVLCGGVSIQVPQVAGYVYQTGMIRSRDGHCRAFDDAADGTVFGSGVGVVALKRLRDAIADGDHIHAVVLGSAINNDGSAKAGFTAPSVEGQVQAIRAAHARAGIDASTVTYVEAHGTGTPLGDPIEIEALSEAFRASTGATAFCAIGAVKTNIGHLDTASGIAGFIKTVLSIEQGFIPPTLHFQSANRRIKFEGSPFFVNAALRAWRPEGIPRRAGVSSLGIGGTNAHVLLEEPPARSPRKAPAVGPCVLALSAKNGASLRALAQKYASCLAEHADVAVADVCYSAALRRRHFEQRVALVAESKDELRGQLHAYLARSDGAGTVAERTQGTQPEIGFVFTGHGAQHAGMGRELFATEPVFQAAFRSCEAAIPPGEECSLEQVVYGASSPRLLCLPRYAHLALFAVQYALAELLRSWGVAPTHVLGHGISEYAAACVAGVFRVQDVTRALWECGRVIEELAPSGPIDAGATPESAVLAYGYYSPSMASVLPSLREVLGKLPANLPECTFLSGTTGRTERAALASSDYWTGRFREQVQLEHAPRRMRERGVRVLVEIGPQSLASGQGEVSAGGGAEALATLRRGGGDMRQMLHALAGLYAAGANIAWKNVHALQRGAFVRVPTYCFQRARYWIDPPPRRDERPRVFGAPMHWALGRQLDVAGIGPIYEAVLRQEEITGSDEHRLAGQPSMPAMSSVEAGFAAAEQLFGAGVHVVEELEFGQGLSLGSAGTLALQLRVTERAADHATFLLHGRRLDGGSSVWTRLAKGALRANAGAETLDTLESELPAAAVDAATSGEVEALYRRLAEFGVDRQGRARGITALHTGALEARARVRIAAEAVESNDTLGCCGLVVDLAAQVLASLSHETPMSAWPRRIAKVAWRVPATSELTISARLSPVSELATGVVGDVVVRDGTGRTVLALHGIELGAMVTDDRQAASTARRLVESRWNELPASGLAPSAVPPVWVVLADSTGVAEQLGRMLERKGARCLMVRPGAAYERVGPRSCVVRPESKQDFELLGEVFGLGAHAAVTFVHLWSLDAERGAASDPEAILRSTCGSIIAATQALLASGQSAADWRVVTRGSQRVRQEDPLVDPLGGALWGLGRVLESEISEWTCRNIDLEFGAGPESSARALFEEICRPTDESQVALRSGRRYGRRLASRDEANCATKSVVLRRDATYLVTGGDGGIGRVLVPWLVQQGARNILLLSRHCAERIDGAAIGEAAANIVRINVDVANTEQLRACLTECARTMPPICGILHAAGVLDDGTIREQTWARWSAVVQPKVAGAWNLHRVAAECDLTLDFFVMFSSVASLLGTPGQSSYAAANAVLDGLSHYRRALGLAATSVNWGGWAETGMTGRLAEAQLRRLSDSGIGQIPVAEALSMLGVIMAADLTQVGVLPMDWARYLASWSGRRAARLLENLQRVGGSDPGARRTAVQETVPPAMLSLDECINVVSRCMREVLGSDAVDARSAATTPFKELGLDSLGALDLCDKLVASTGLKLRPTVLFECPNADAVARRLLELQTAGADRVRDDVRGGREERRDERTRGLPMQPEFVRSELEEELARLEEVL